MDKIQLSTMGIFPKPEEKVLHIGEADVTVLTYIPYEQMLDMIQWCIDYIINDRPFLSAPLKRIMKNFAILKFYTNFDFSFLETYHEMSQIYGEYDYIQRFGLLDQVLPIIDKTQLEFFDTTLDETLESIMAYRNSAVGIVDALSENAERDVNDMQKALDFIGDGVNAEKIEMLTKAASAISGGQPLTTILTPPEEPTVEDGEVAEEDNSN